MKRDTPHRDGDQLLLELFKGVPWDGRSPRALTRVGLGVILKARAPEPRGVASEAELERLGQLQLWPYEKKSPFVYEGAPLLLESQGRGVLDASR